MAARRALVPLGFGDCEAGFAVDVVAAGAFAGFDSCFEADGAFEVVVEEGVLGDFVGNCGLLFLLHVLEE